MPRRPLTPRQEKVLASLLAGATIETAAGQAKASVRTVKRWLQDPAFRAAYAQERRRLVEDALVKLELLASHATLTLGRNLNCGKGPVEVKAALGILAQLTRLQETLT